MVASDDEVIKSIEKGTYGTPQVKLRTEKWFKILREIMGYPKEDRRIYTTEEKSFYLIKQMEFVKFVKIK